MTYGQMRDRVLMLLNQYSIAGGKIRVTYNNQADYLARVPGEVNEALVDNPRLVSDDPMKNWIIKIEISDPKEVEQLLDQEAYDAICDAEHKE